MKILCYLSTVIATCTLLTSQAFAQNPELDHKGFMPVAVKATVSLDKKKGEVTIQLKRETSLYLGKISKKKSVIAKFTVPEIKKAAFELNNERTIAIESVKKKQVITFKVSACKYKKDLTLLCDAKEVQGKKSAIEQLNSSKAVGYYMYVNNSL